MTKDNMSVQWRISVLSQARKNVKVAIHWVSDVFAHSWFVLFRQKWSELFHMVKLHQTRISYGTRSSRTCMSKQGTLSYKENWWEDCLIWNSSKMKFVRHVRMRSQRKHHIEVKIWLALLSRFKWYVWISTDQSMSYLRQNVNTL